MMTRIVAAFGIEIACSLTAPHLRQNRQQLVVRQKEEARKQQTLGRQIVVEALHDLIEQFVGRREILLQILDLALQIKQVGRALGRVHQATPELRVNNGALKIGK